MAITPGQIGVTTPASPSKILDTTAVTVGGTLVQREVINIASPDDATPTRYVLVSAAGELLTGGGLTNNNAVPAANNIGALTAIANAAAPSFTEGDMVLMSSDLAGNHRIIGTVTASYATPTTSTFTQVAISFAASGDNTVVAAVSAKTTRVYQMTFVCSGATAITIKNGAGASLTGAMAFNAGGSLTLDFVPNPRFITSSNTAFIINSSNAVQVSGWLDYTQS